MIKIFVLFVSFKCCLSSGIIYRPFNDGVYCTPSTPIKSPASLAELQQIVVEAKKLNLTVKAFGSRHSMTDIICTDGIPISMKDIKYAKMNGDDSATFGAGIELMDAMEFLERNGRSLMSVPTYGGITLGGALGTGAMGSSLLHPTTISDVVIGVTVLTASGKVLEIKDPKELRHFKVHLGLLGILVDITLKTVPLFKLRMHNFPISDEVLRSEPKVVLDWAKGYDFFQFWWFPYQKEVIISRGAQVDLEEWGNASTNFIPSFNQIESLAFSNLIELVQLTRSRISAGVFESTFARSLHSSVITMPPIFTEDGITLKNPAVGFGWRLQTNRCVSCAWEGNGVRPDTNAVNFDLKDFSRVVTTLKRILSSSSVFLPYGLFFRFIKASDATMSTANGRDSFVVEMISVQRKDPLNSPKFGLDALQLMQQVLVSLEGARPHWQVNGLHYSTNEVISKAISEENKDAFIQAMKRYDPEGLFLNKFGRRLLGLSGEMDVDPKAKRCALQDSCICHKNRDCGVGQICVRVFGFNVCKDISGLLSTTQEAVQLKVLKDLLV